MQRTKVQCSIAGVSLGWLGAAGTVSIDALAAHSKIAFDSFWVSRSEGGGPRDSATASAALINAVGKVFFFESLSVFPVAYASEKACVFEFPPLSARIAAARLSGLPV